MVKSH